MLSYAKYVMSYLKARRGQGMTEYAVILALVVAIAVLVMGQNGTLGAAITTLFTNTATAVGVIPQ